nr:MAG TPA: hypothetical protein [Caudoviricetes sp.]
MILQTVVKKNLNLLRKNLQLKIDKVEELKLKN